MKDSPTEIAFATCDGIRTAYRTVGKGPLLFLIHGAEADHSMFLGLSGALSRDYTVVAYDQRDSGQTENGSSSYGLEDLANDAAKLMAIVCKLHGVNRGHVFGTSFGGQIAQVLAARHPTVVDRLVLSSTWRVGRPVVQFGAEVVQTLASLRVDSQVNAPAIAAYYFTKEYLTDHPEAIDMFRGGTKRTDSQQNRRSQVIQTVPPRVDFSTVSAPTLLLAGGSDKLIPPHATFELADHILGAECNELSRLPHVSALEAPERVAAAIHPFLKR